MRSPSAQRTWTNCWTTSFLSSAGSQKGKSCHFKAFVCVCVCVCVHVCGCVRSFLCLYQAILPRHAQCPALVHYFRCVSLYLSVCVSILHNLAHCPVSAISLCERECL